MIWLLAAAGCSTAIAVILKLNESRGGDRVLLAGANYVVASLLALAILGWRIERPGGITLALGAIAGIDYVLGFLLLMAGIARGPLAVPVTVMRLSVVVPIVVSVFIWNESPAPPQWFGIVVGIAAIALFGAGIGDGTDRARAGAGRADPAAGRGAADGRSYWILVVALFVVMGIGDVLLKACRELSPGAERLLFTWILFTTAALFTWAWLIARRVPLRRDTALLGCLLGVPNLFSTIFTLRALETTPASVAFPFLNLVVILGTTVLGYAVWRERLGRLHIAGLVTAAAAILLLPLGR